MQMKKNNVHNLSEATFVFVKAGVFVQADKETLQHRVIKKAKRRGTGSEDVSQLTFNVITFLAL